MPRPCKRRRVCARPARTCFGPIDREGDLAGMFVSMTLDEYECIRLMDLEGLTQEQCAEQMEVARTTVQAIYQEARRKLARCLVQGLELQIGGGSYTLCREGGRCRRRHCREIPQGPRMEGDKTMKIGVTYENGEIFQHFGHTEQFKIYDVEDGKITKEQVVDTNGSGHGALAGFLKDLQADTLICGGIGAGAQNALAEAGIQLYGGVSGSADDAVKALAAGTLSYNPDVQCSHHGNHEHGEGHSCGHGHEHGHGDHECRHGNCGR